MGLDLDHRQKSKFFEFLSDSFSIVFLKEVARLANEYETRVVEQRI